MKKYWLVFLMSLFLCSSSFADIKILGQVDNLKPISFGVGVSSLEGEYSLAFYSNVYLLYMFGDKLRLGVGFMAADYNDKFRVRFQTSATLLLFDRFETGAFYCPFYNLDPRSKDPYGVIFGVAINI